MIHEEICTYEVAKLAKEKGFNWGCLNHYDSKGSLHQHYAYDAMNSGVGIYDLLMYDGHLYTSECLAPTQSLLQRWLREEKNIHISINADREPDDEFIWYTHTVWVDTGYSVCSWWERPKVVHYTTYELALEDALKYALEKFI